jgi:hypothetical protein
VRRAATAAIAVLIVGSIASCGGSGSNTSPTSSSATSAHSTTTITAPTFEVSANDFITALNPQLPLVVDGSAPLGTDTRGDSVFGGQITSDKGVFILTDQTLFDHVEAVTVRVKGAGGAFTTPAQLLAAVGASLWRLSADALDAFRSDALPRLGTLTQTRTTMTVGTFYVLTAAVVDSSTLDYVFSPIGSAPPAGAERLGS